MAWYCIDLDGTLMQELDDGSQQPVDGAVDAMLQLSNEGNRLTVFTSRFAPMPEEKKEQLRQEIEEELQANGFPEMEVWTGTTKPDADVFLDDKAVTFDGDWGLALAQATTMLQDRGLIPLQPMEEEPIAADDEASYSGPQG